MLGGAYTESEESSSAAERLQEVAVFLVQIETPQEGGSELPAVYELQPSASAFTAHAESKPELSMLLLIKMSCLNEQPEDSERPCRK